MLRVIFVVSLIVGLSVFALQGPVEALVLYLWLAYFRPEAWVYTPFFRTLPLSFIAAGYLLLRFSLSSVRPRLDLRVLVLLAFISLALVSALNSPHYEQAIAMFLILLKAFLVSYLLAVLTGTMSSMRIVVQTICLSLAFEGAKQGWVQLLMHPGTTNNNKVPFLGDNNGVAVGMLMLVPMFFYLARTTDWKQEKWLYWFFAVGVLYRGLSTYSRGGFLAAAAMGLVSIARSPRRVPALIAGVIVAGVIAAALPQAYWDRMGTIQGEETESGTQYDGSAEGRLHFWAIALRMANDRSIGVGPGAYQEAYAEYDTDPRYGVGRAVHSSWFGTAAEMGYGGLALLVWILLLAWSSCARAQRLAKAGRVPPAIGYCGAGLEASLVAFVVGGSFLTFQYIEMLWHFVALSMGLHWNVRHALEAGVGKAAVPSTKSDGLTESGFLVPGVRRVS